MELEDAIKHLKEKLDDPSFVCDGTCEECANEHRELLEWLEELAYRRDCMARQMYHSW